MMGYVKPYTSHEKQFIADNLELNTADILDRMNGLYGNNRSLSALKNYIAKNYKKPVYRANRKPDGATRMVRGREQVKVNGKWIKRDRIIAGAKDDEVITYKANGEPVAVSRGEHLRLAVMGYKYAHNEVKKSLRLIAKVQQKASEIEK